MSDTEYPSLAEPTCERLPATQLREANATAAIDRARGAAYWPAYDGLRVFAILAIVWFHVNTTGFSRQLAYAGLPVFLVLSFALVVRSADQQAFTTLMRRRSQRLLVPFLFWYFVYALVVGYLRVHHGLALVRPTLLEVVRGPSIHLWYLPYVFAATLVIRALLRVSASAPGVWATLLGALGCILLAAHPAFDLPTPLAQWWYAAPTIGIGFALSYAREAPRHSREYALALAIGVLAACAYLAGGPDASTALSYALGVTLVIGFSFIDLPRVAAVQSLASLTLGIYVLHPLVLIVLEKLLGPMQHAVARFGIAVFGATVVTWLLRRFTFGQLVTGA